jgi:large subunit ribosomal protein L22
VSSPRPTPIAATVAPCRIGGRGLSSRLQTMQVKAVGKYVRVQPRKVRIIADQVRETRAEHTVHLLRYHTSKSAKELRKVLLSAMANAQENHGISPDQLKIAAITIDAGPRLKRMRARAMGRGYRIEKKTSHITVLVEDAEAAPPVKPHGTKAKPRPTFATKKTRTKAKTEAKPAAEPEEVVQEPIAEIAEAPVAEASAEVTAAPETEAPAATEAVATEEPAETPEAEPATEGEGEAKGAS